MLTPHGTGVTVTARRWAPWILLALAFLFYYLSVLHVDLLNTGMLDLEPGPDAVEYYAQAKSLAGGGLPEVRIGLDRLPSRYPAGYPALMVPWLAILPESRAITAPFRTNQVLGAGLLAMTFAFLYRRSRPMGAGLAVLLLATQPSFLAFSRSSMSELSAAFAVLAAFMLTSSGLARGSRPLIYFAAALLGFGLNIRLSLLFFAPLLLAAYFAGNARPLGSRLMHIVGCFLVFLLFFSPTLILNALAFGHPLKTGYHFWVPGAGGEGGPFNLQYVPGNLRLLWDEFAMSWSTFRVAHIFGSGAYFTPPFLLLALAGLRGRRWSTFSFCAALSAGTFLFASICYFHLDVRLYFPLIILAVPIAASPMERWLHTSFKRTWSYSSTAIPLLFVLALIGFPSAAGYPARQGAIQLFEALHWGNELSPSLRFLAARFAAREVPVGALVLADMSPVYLSAVLPEGIHAAPVDGRHDYSFSTSWHYARPEAQRLVSSSLDKGRPVYALADHSANTADILRRLPSVPGTDWEISAKDVQSNAVLFRLKRSRPRPPS